MATAPGRVTVVSRLRARRLLRALQMMIPALACSVELITVDSQLHPPRRHALLTDLEISATGGPLGCSRSRLGWQASSALTMGHGRGQRPRIRRRCAPWSHAPSVRQRASSACGTSVRGYAASFSILGVGSGQSARRRLSKGSARFGRDAHARASLEAARTWPPLCPASAGRRDVEVHVWMAARSSDSPRSQARRRR